MLLTSDEEGDAVDGTVYALECLDSLGVPPWQMVLIGEPSSDERLADTIRVGRRGSLTARVTVKGKQGHVAYPHRVDNPIHRCVQFISALHQHTWCNGFEEFPPTSLQIARIHADAGGENVVPAFANFTANWRYSPALTMEEIRATFDRLAQELQVEADVEWHLSGKPFFSQEGTLRRELQGCH